MVPPLRSLAAQRQPFYYSQLPSAASRDGPRGPGVARKDKAPTPDSSPSESHLDSPKAHKGLLSLAPGGRGLGLLLVKGRGAISRITAG